MITGSWAARCPADLHIGFLAHTPGRGETRSKKALKLTVSLALVASAVGGFGLGLVWATPPSQTGFTSTPLVGPAVLDAIDTSAETGAWELELKTRGLSDV